jgi:hypothetical protein
VLGLAACLLGTPAAATAVVVDDGGAKVGGYLVRKDDGKLTMRVRMADGTEKTVDYDLTKVKIEHEIDRARLEGLSKDEPRKYREYAEELAAQKDDPEARDMAMRLFLISAYLDPRKHGHNALVRMSALAGTPAEARRCLAMAYLLDPRGDAGVLKADAAKQALPKAQAGALVDFLKALHAYRTGQIKAAREAAGREGVDRVFNMAPGIGDRKAFLQRCTDTICPTCRWTGKASCDKCNGKGVIFNQFGQVVACTACNGQKAVACAACDGTGVNLAFPDDVMRTVLRAELWAVHQLAGGDAGGKERDAGWSSVLHERRAGPAAPLTLETITEFDPRKCHYRNGAWVAP